MRPHCRTSSWLAYVCHSPLLCHRHFQSTYIFVTLAPLLRIISMSTASMSLSSPHALASQLPGAPVLSVEQSLFAAEDCAHYAPTMRRLHAILDERFLDICQRCHETSMPHANPVVSYPCIPSPRCILITHRLHYHGQHFYLPLIILSRILTPVCVCSHTLWL